jgi:phosphohistidine swiveling domain-containing protein
MGSLLTARENGTTGIFSAAEDGSPDPRLVGNKAMNLWRLARAGLPVPRWFVISNRTFLSLLGGELLDLRQVLEIHGPSEARGVFEERFQAAGRRQLETMVREELSRGCAGVHLFAVRSSAVDEDSRGTSFAGLLESFLFVRREDLTDRIIRCAGSALSERVVTYRKARRLPLDGLGVAVIVQEMIESAKSGVLFTRDPVSGSDAWVVAAGFGLGEGVVANLVETDTLWLDPEGGTILTARVGNKRTKMVPAGDGRGGTDLVAIPETGEPILTPGEIESLFRLKQKVEKLFEEPQDLEWAFDGSGELHILQARPITTLGKGEGQGTVWDNSNIVESYPGVSTPLTYSFARYVYQQVMKETIGGFTLNRRAVENDAPIFETLIGYLDGRIYYNLTNWYRMVSFIPALAGDKSACNRMLGIRDKVAVPLGPIRPSCLSYPVLLWKFCLRRLYRRRFYRRFDRLYRTFSRVDFESASPAELYGIFKRLEAGLVRIWPTTIENDLFVMFFYELINRLLNNAGCADEFGAIQGTCLRAATAMESTKPVKSLRELARLISCSPRLRALLDFEDEDVLAAIREVPEFGELAGAIEQHIERYGDRTLQELKLETKSMRDDPAILIQLVRRAVSDGARLEAKESTENGLEINKLLRSLPLGLFRRLLLRWLLARAREGVVHRENMRFARTRIYGLVKRIFRAMGKAYCRLGLLGDPEDIFFLSMEEVFALVNGSAVTLDCNATVRVRREEYERHRRSPTPPSRLVTTGAAVSAPRVALGGAAGEGSALLRGIGCSAGQVTGRAKIVRHPEPGLKVGGDILVAEMTDPGWVFLMMSARGVIVERGSILSHTAIIGREFGIPTITGLARATERIVDGELIAMDGATGVVTRLGETNLRSEADSRRN